MTQERLSTSPSPYQTPYKGNPHQGHHHPGHHQSPDSRSYSSSEDYDGDSEESNNSDIITEEMLEEMRRQASIPAQNGNGIRLQSPHQSQYLKPAYSTPQQPMVVKGLPSHIAQAFMPPPAPQPTRTIPRAKVVGPTGGRVAQPQVQQTRRQAVPVRQNKRMAMSPLPYHGNQLVGRSPAPGAQFTHNQPQISGGITVPQGARRVNYPPQNISGKKAGAAAPRYGNYLAVPGTQNVNRR